MQKSNPQHNEAQYSPQPLATKPVYVKRARTSASGLLQYSNRGIVTNTIPSYPRPSFPSEDSIRRFTAHYPSKRSRKLQAEIFADQHFLREMRKLWLAKLDQLRLDHAILKDMTQFSESDTETVEPLFDHWDINGNTLKSSSSVPSSSKNEQINELVPKVKSQKEQTCSSSQQDEQLHRTLESEDQVNLSADHEDEDNEDNEDDEDDEDDEDEDEDEETARRALNFMLEEFGDQLL